MSIHGIFFINGNSDFLTQSCFDCRWMQHWIRLICQMEKSIMTKETSPYIMCSSIAYLREPWSLCFTIKSHIKTTNDHILPLESVCFPSSSSHFSWVTIVCETRETNLVFHILFLLGLYSLMRAFASSTHLGP